MRISACKTVDCRLLIALLGLVVTQFVAGAQTSQPVQGRMGDDYTLQLNADMVILSATVLNGHNALVSGLGKDNFEIFEDGVQQQIEQFSHEDLPVTAGILVDNSASMAAKRNDVVAAAMAFALSSNPQDQMFVVNFNDRVFLGLPPGTPFTDSPAQLQQALTGITAIGQTSLYDGIAVGLDHLQQGCRDKKVLIVISDGGDNASRHSLDQVIAMARQSTAIIYAIGIFDELDSDQNPGVLKRFAKDTGGEAFFPKSSSDIAAICQSIARDIRNQYTLTYVPRIASRDGSFRTISVKASAPGYGHLSVRTRTGYSVPSIAPATASRRQ
jgi:VWFA-related protein